MSLADSIGEMLRVAFAGDDNLPQSFIDLLDRLTATSSDPPRALGGLSDTEFKALLVDVIPRLRSFALSLARNSSVADDLVQEALIRAWNARDRYAGGTNFKAWTLTILRNQFLNGLRRRKHTAEWNDEAAEKVLIGAADQDRNIHVADVAAALRRLPAEQRQALMLVGAEQLTYEQTAEICGVPIGTIKSRVARGRAALVRLVESEPNEEAA